MSPVGGRSGSKSSNLEPALEAFEPVFFNNRVLLLENYFVHRSRTIEKKDGDPLNEVRVLCNSLMSNEGIMGSRQDDLDEPDHIGPGISVGDEIRLSEELLPAVQGLLR